MGGVESCAQRSCVWRTHFMAAKANHYSNGSKWRCTGTHLQNYQDLWEAWCTHHLQYATQTRQYFFHFSARLASVQLATISVSYFSTFNCHFSWAWGCFSLKPNWQQAYICLTRKYQCHWVLLILWKVLSFLSLLLDCQSNSSTRKWWLKQEHLWLTILLKQRQERWKVAQAKPQKSGRLFPLKSSDKDKSPAKMSIACVVEDIKKAPSHAASDSLSKDWLANTGCSHTISPSTKDI